MKQTGTDLTLEREEARMGCFLRSSGCLAGRYRFPIAFPHLKAFMVLSRRFDPYWCVPSFGEAGTGFEGEGQFLLWKDDQDRHHLFIPLVSHDCRSVLSFGDGEFRIETEAPARGIPTPPLIAYESESADLYGMLEEAAEEISLVLRTVRSRTEKTTPAWVDYFGWCTWDAFYQDLSWEKVISGLQSWHEGGLDPGLIILDDGWLDAEHDFLCSLRPDPEKFPRGLKGLIEEAKERYGIAVFGIWHTMEGYWAGVHPESELARRWPLNHNRNRIRPWLGADDAEIDLYLLDPNAAASFYLEFYDRLRSDGVDMVKVDGQSALERFTCGKLDRVRSMHQYQEALQGAAAAHLNGQTLHCMSHGSDVIFNLDYSMVIRNSSDYLPGWNRKGHQGHIINNAFNALYLSLFGLPDWDMFQSCHFHSEFHAAARALSGGPVYVSDIPGTQDFALVERLVCFEKGAASVLRCPDPALPSPESLYGDPASSRDALKVFNHANGIGLLGLFHCADTDEPITSEISLRDLPVLEAEDAYAVWLVRAEKLMVLDPGEHLSLHLESMGYELAVFSKIRDGCAPLGLIDKFNPPAGLNRIVHEKTFVRMDCRDGGRIGFYCRSAPESVELGRRSVPFIHNADSGLLIIRAPEREPHQCRISLHS